MARWLGAFSSFFVSGDPNTLKLTATDVPGVPALIAGEEFVIDSSGFNNVKIPQLEQRCTFWKKTAQKIPL